MKNDSQGIINCIKTVFRTINEELKKLKVEEIRAFGTKDSATFWLEQRRVYGILSRAEESAYKAIKEIPLASLMPPMSLKDVQNATVSIGEKGFPDYCQECPCMREVCCHVPAILCKHLLQKVFP